MADAEIAMRLATDAIAIVKAAEAVTAIEIETVSARIVIVRRRIATHARSARKTRRANTLRSAPIRTNVSSSASALSSSSSRLNNNLLSSNLANKHSLFSNRHGQPLMAQH